MCILNTVMPFIVAMVCERITPVFHQLSYTTSIMCYHYISDMSTPYSIPGISGHWKINGTVLAFDLIAVYIRSYNECFILLETTFGW